MGYRSDVAIAFAFERREQIDEVLAIYAMHPLVQKHDLAKLWEVHDWSGVWGLTYKDTSVKWYSNYEDVQALEYMKTLVETFHNERGEDVGETDENGKQDVVIMFPFAFRMLRVGENDEDIETHADDAGPHMLHDELFERMTVRREIDTTF